MSQVITRNMKFNFLEVHARLHNASHSDLLYRNERRTRYSIQCAVSLVVRKINIFYSYSCPILNVTAPAKKGHVGK